MIQEELRGGGEQRGKDMIRSEPRGEGRIGANRSREEPIRVENRLFFIKITFTIERLYLLL